jgi:hypothetical protein
MSNINNHTMSLSLDKSSLNSSKDNRIVGTADLTGELYQRSRVDYTRSITSPLEEVLYSIYD